VSPGQVSPGRVSTAASGLAPAASAGPADSGLSLARLRGLRFGSGRFTDGLLLALSLFSVGWIAVLRHAYEATGVGPGSFVVDLIHPVADLIVLAATLRLALRAGRPALLPYLALCAATVGDFVAVQARASAMHPGAWAQLAWLASIALLGAVGLVPAAAAGSAARARAGVARPPRTTAIALAAAGVSAPVTLIFGIVTWDHSGPVPLLAATVLILGLVARCTALLRQAAAMSALAADSENQFHQLADRTSDVVLVCDAAGRISYASHAVAAYGYRPEELAGTSLAGLIHPDDQPAVVAAADAVSSGVVVASESLACRVRSSDGTWRYVQASISQYSEAGQADLLLVTARDVSDQMALRQQVTHLTFHDGLTGLPNRSYLEERAKDLLAADHRGRSGRAGAILVDLDGFTEINDSAGQSAGDLVLAQAGRRLRGRVPAHDTVARWGGDGFAVLIENADSAQEIVDLAERLAGAIAAEPFAVAGRDVAITASLGVALDDPGEAEHLLRNADLALSRARDAGGGRVEVFAAHMHADVLRRLELATGLRAAIEAGELSVEYQPVVELATGRVASVEALVRWSRDGEQIEPVEFLGVAEDSGLIGAVGAVVLAAACQAAAEWRERAGRAVPFSVNFSKRQVSAAGFGSSVLAALAATRLPPAALTLEVTERVLMEVDAPVLDALADLRLAGARLAIDDFGTGYASLAYLRELPVDIIKIDPSFVAGLGTDGTLAMLTRTIVQVGHDLGIEIVAEGIERPEQLELLRAMGCGLGQGFLLAPPMSAAAIEAMISAGHGGASGEPEVPDEPDVPDEPLVTGPGLGNVRPERKPGPELMPAAERTGPAAPAAPAQAG
jgi:diguanylate cyclase (GGDEF)-like protein/PAS domain S-box-containing protein